MEDPFAALSDCLVPESAFDEAFARMEAEERARIKKNVAQLHAMYADCGCAGRREDREWTQGLRSRLLERPFSRAAVCFPDRLQAHPRLTAAVLPPLAAGVTRCCAVRIGEGGAQWPPLLLGALELAGVEEVFDTDRERFRGWLRDLAGDPDTRLVFLEEPAADFGLGAAGGGPVLLPEARSLGIWFEEPEQWDLEAIRAAHPRAGLLWGGPAAPEATHPRERVVEGGAEELFAAEPDALFLPHSLLDQAVARCSRIFGPGQEGCWIWPEMGRETFLRRSVCLSYPEKTIYGA